MEVSTKKRKKLDEFNEDATRHIDPKLRFFSTFLSFFFIYLFFFLSFFFIYLFLSLSFPRETVCQTVVCTEMTRTSDDKPTQEVSGPWQAFIYDPTSPLRTDEPVNRIYRWKWRSIAASCLESTIRA